MENQLQGTAKNIRFSAVPLTFMEALYEEIDLFFSGA
jgi:hypothetical protein